MSSISRNVPLSSYSSFRIGGSARYFAKAESTEDLKEILKKWKEISANFSESEKKIIVIGGGTNLLIGDAGYSGLVILNSIEFIKNENGVLSVGAGVTIEKLLFFCIENSLSGLEWAGGLPGTLGGAVRGNAGAFGGEIKDVVVRVESVDKKTFETTKRENNECKFGYRDSIFKSDKGEIIVGIELKLIHEEKEEIERLIDEKIEYRNKKHPRLSEFPNIGSTFKNIPAEKLSKKVLEEFKEKIKTDPFPVLPSVKLISGAGLTNKRVGGIMVSDIHPNYLVNIGNGKSDEVLELISEIKKAVLAKYGVELEEEITII